jgi:hypothetical protein
VVQFATTAARGVTMPTDDFQTDPPQPRVPPHAVPHGRWPAWVVNVLGYVLGFAATWVMMAIILLVLVWLFGPTTVGTPATPP